MLPMGLSRRRLLNQSTLRVWQTVGFQALPGTSAADDFCLEEADHQLTYRQAFTEREAGTD
jgi:hypothetical protein